MDDRPTCLERAFALATASSCRTIPGIRKQLRSEGYVDEGQLSGRHVRNQLTKLLAASRVAPTG